MTRIGESSRYRIMKNYLLILMLAMGLAGCGGSSGGAGVKQNDPVTEDPTDVPTDETDPDDLIDTGDTTNVSYLPLMTLELYKDWSGFENDRRFRIYGHNPFIEHLMISPVDATTLAPIDNALISDFDVMEDDVPLNPQTNFQMLQKVLGNQIHLNTAIVINTSPAMDLVDRAALINAIKDYVNSVKQSRNEAIKNQTFTVWAFDGGRVAGDGGIVEETNGFTSDTTELHSALDTVLAGWSAGKYRVSGTNHAYDAVVEAIGRFKGDGPFSNAEDLSTDGPNDLWDYVTSDGVWFSNILLFSAGYSDTNRFNAEYAVKAIESQSLSVYDTDSDPSGSASATKELGKALFYMVPEGEAQDGVFAGLAAGTFELEYSSGRYSFASSLIVKQEEVIASRINTENQYVIRYASAIRSGEGHKAKLASRTAEDKYGYSLEWEFDRVDFDPSLYQMPEPTPEITGANNEYLSANVAFYSDIQTFYPATRWTNAGYSTNSYSWASTGDISINTDGSVTVAASNSFPIELTLTNDALAKSVTIEIR